MPKQNDLHVSLNFQFLFYRSFNNCKYCSIHADYTKIEIIQTEFLFYWFLNLVVNML